jgi:NADPH:quinone reductase-like Zn-dependent oxidoreductase
MNPRPILSLLAFAIAAITSPAHAADTMKAIQYSEYGAPEVLHYVDVAKPVPGPGEVLVKVDAAGVNTIDWELRLREIPKFSPKLPAIPGFDLAGRIVALGDGVTGHPIGEQIYTMLPLDKPNAYAEYARVPVSALAPAPRTIDAVHAAAVPMAALTAWQAIFDAGGLKQGQTVLIHGAAGGVAHMAVQLAKHAGATVIGTASASNLDFVRGLGADQVIDYKTQKFEEVVHDVDLVFDTVGDDTLERSYQVIRKGGRLVTIAGRVKPETAEKYGISAKGIVVHPDPQQLAEVAKLLDAGAIRAEIDSVYPLADAAKAHAKSESRHLHGRLVLTVGGVAKPGVSATTP